MNKSLSEMTLNELWELFPVILSEHKTYWSDWYVQEKRRIETFLQIHDVRISHVGSTAVPGIWAKLIIDILVEIPKTASMEYVKEVLTRHGYICMSERDNRKSFNKGYTENGFAEKVFHLHLRYYGDHDELYFRDYLKGNPAAAKEYEALKLSLWKKYEHNRDAYTDAKSEFVKECTEKAKLDHRGCGQDK